MKKCPYCKIEVGGDPVKCPLCQSRLMGEGEDAYFPKPTALKIRSFLYKLQLFLVWVMVILSLGLDYLFGMRIPGFEKVHWGLIVSLWLIGIEFGIMRQFKPGTGSARKVSMMVLILLIMLAVTSWFFGFFELTMSWIVPIVLMASMIASFILAMIDKRGNAMAYLLTELLFGVLPFLVLFIRNDVTPVAWIVCMLLSAILFVGAVIFKGRTVAMELVRRFNM